MFQRFVEMEEVQDGKLFVKMLKPSPDDSAWLKSVVSLTDGYEAQIVEQFTQRLIRLAQSRLPQRLIRRCDAEDIVQSVFHSFFQRNEDQQFDIHHSNDLWRLLAAMTYKKTMQAIEFHSRQRRDYGREQDAQQSTKNSAMQNPIDDPTASAIAMMAELLDKILVQLPVQHQEILRLRLLDHSIDEIAEQIRVSSRTVDRALKASRQIAERLMMQNE